MLNRGKIRCILRSVVFLQKILVMERINRVGQGDVGQGDVFLFLVFATGEAISVEK